jgi:hypothetical protein
MLENGDAPDDAPSILAVLQTLEPLIYAANDGKPRAHFEQLLAPDFWEVGASGKIYSREFVLSTLEERNQNPRVEAWHTFDFALRRVEAHHVLLTYALQQPTRLSRRATLWRQTGAGWQMVYHQGTPVV